jgi:outer membrane lipoprotein carrier protein
MKSLRLACAFAWALFAGIAAAQPTNAIDQFRAFNQSTQSARAEFSQTVFDPRGKVSQQARGTFLFQRPGKFRWVYEKPAQLIVGDGTKVWFFDQDLNQVTIRKLDKAFSSTPAALLAGKSDIEAAFTLVAGGTQDGLAWVNAEPKSKDTGIDRVRLAFTGNLLAAMELYDSFGNRTRIDFSKLERNVKTDARDFSFTPPKGADVVSE